MKLVVENNPTILNQCLNSSFFKTWLYGRLGKHKLVVWAPSLVILLLILVNLWEFPLTLLFSLAKVLFRQVQHRATDYFQVSFELKLDGICLARRSTYIGY